MGKYREQQLPAVAAGEQLVLRLPLRRGYHPAGLMVAGLADLLQAPLQFLRNLVAALELVANRLALVYQRLAFSAAPAAVMLGIE